MSSKVGQVYFAHEKRLGLLGIGAVESHDYSEATAEMIDREIQEIIANEYSRALEILKSREDILKKGAQLLLEKEKIEGNELQALMHDS